VVADLDWEFFTPFDERATQIAAAELLAVVLLCLHFHEQLSAGEAAIFVDNVGVIFNLVKGAASSRDLASLSYAVHLLWCQHQITPWVEHIASWSNLADGGSRVGVSDPVAAAASVRLLQVPPPTLPSSYPFVRLDEWVAWFAREVKTSSINVQA